MKMKVRLRVRLELRAQNDAFYAKCICLGRF